MPRDVKVEMEGCWGGAGTGTGQQGRMAVGGGGGGGQGDTAPGMRELRREGVPGKGSQTRGNRCRQRSPQTLKQALETTEKTPAWRRHHGGQMTKGPAQAQATGKTPFHSHQLLSVGVAVKVTCTCG